ncbi:hypothetical protein [Robiginitomaculum antarcticum]|uniref:hypothetical protein n=1 Tax=Robiginitomaculum antarcticum TaxID=437507 RepID=UPI000362551D|nr:hypothetical protein [Robiginitomaculum antarcticum]
MTTEPRIWLHVGPPKTATSAVQYWLRKHNEALKEIGISYPDMFGTDNDKHSFLVRALRQDPKLTLLEDALSKNKSPTLIFSDEGLCNHLDDFDPTALTRFRYLTEGYRVGILIVHRQPEPWIKSYHKQCVLNPDNGASPLWGTAMNVETLSEHLRVKRLMNIRGLVESLKGSFGAVTVKTFQFESTDWFDDMLDTIGAGHLTPANLPKSNVSVPDWATECLRRVNAVTHNQDLRNYWKSALQIYLQTNHTILTNLKQSDSVQRDQLTHIYLSQGIDSFPSSQQSAIKRFLETVSSL